MGFRTRIDRDGERVGISQSAALVRRTCWFRGSTLTSCNETDGSGRALLEVLYEGLDSSPTSLPSRIVLRFPETRQELVISLSRTRTQSRRAAFIVHTLARSKYTGNQPRHILVVGRLCDRGTSEYELSEQPSSRLHCSPQPQPYLR